MYAGGINRVINKEMYLAKNLTSYWTMTPYNYYRIYVSFGNSVMFESGALDQYANIENSLGLRPVINIRSDILISSGDGTLESPYELMLK